MKKLNLAVFLFLSCLVTHAKFNGLRTDSTDGKLHFHFAISLKPVVNWIHLIDSGGNFFNSPIQYEPQFSFRNHYLVFGFNYTVNEKEYLVNNQPNQRNKLNYSISPSYHYKILKIKKWQLFLGVAYTYNYTLDDYWLVTPLEVITKTYTIKDNGIAPYVRIAYQFNKYLSLETETAYYFTKSTTSYYENYPLTPSLGEKTNYSDRYLRFSVPSNIFLKISF